MNKALAELLKLIQKLYGKRALSKTIGTRTNVITLPDKETKKFVTQELNIEAASDAAVKKGFEDAEKLIADIPKMNDQEILTFKNNLQRMDNRVNPPQAEVIQFGTKQPISKEGIASLTEQAGQKAPPGTVMGNLESRLNQLRASGEGLEALTKGKGQTLDDILGDVMQSQKAMSKLQDEGLVRAAVRYKMMDDLKRGTLKLPKNLEDVVRGASNEEDVITVFRNNYGEDALEQVDSLVPDFYNMTSPADAVKKIEKDFPKIKPKKIKTKQTMDLDEATKAEEENILTPKKPEEPEEFAIGGRVEMASGGVTALKALINFFAKQRGKKGSQLLSDINPKRLGYLQNMLRKSDKELLDTNRQEYLENLSDIVKSDKKLLDTIKEMPEEAREIFFTMANEGGNKGRLSVYKNPDFNIEDAIAEIEQMKKNLKFKDVPEEEVKRKMNAIGGRVGYAYGSGLKLIKLLKDKGTSLKKAIEDAVNNVFPTGDKKLDADMIVDDILETYNIDRDAVDGYDILDAYDQAYKKIAREELKNKIKKVDPNIDISDPETASDFAKFAKQNDPEGYKKIEKIVDDVNNKNKAITKNAENELIEARKNVAQSQDFVGDDVKYDARLLAEELALVRLKTNYEDLDSDTQLNLFDESYNHLLDLIQERGQIKGAVDVRSGKNILTGKQEMKPEALPGEDPITPKKRTLNASGGLAYLMGL